VRSQLKTNREERAERCGWPGRAIAGAAILIASLSTVCYAQAAASDAPATIHRAETDARTIHVTVGHSFFLDTKSRLRRVYIADPAVLDSITLSPNQIIVTAMTPGITSLILLDEEGHAQSFVVSSDLDVENLRTAMSQAMPHDNVSVQGMVGRVVLSGRVSSDAAADAAVKLASLYTKDVANALIVSPGHPKQVRLDVRILEVDRTKLLQLGINLFNPGGNTSFLAATTTGQYPSAATLTPSTSGGIGNLTTTNPLNFMLYSAKLNLGATIQDLQSKQVLQILAEPTITTISGEKASFLSGGQFPFPVVQPGSGAGSTSVVTIQFREYGVKVEFTPIVNEDGTIRLHVTPEVSSLDYTNSVTIGGSTIPALSTRRADTDVELHSNESFAISGLLDQRTTDLLSKTPGASSIPVLGALFKSKNTNHSTTELVVVVTPTVVDPLSETFEPKQPDLPIPTLDTGSFDKSLGKNHNPSPAAPPLQDGNPFTSVQPPASPAAAPVATPAVATQKPVPQAAPAAATPSRLAAPVATPAVAVATPVLVAAPAVAARTALPQSAPTISTPNPVVLAVAPPVAPAPVQPRPVAFAPAPRAAYIEPLAITATAVPQLASAPAALTDAPIASVAVPTVIAPAIDSEPHAPEAPAAVANVSAVVPANASAERPMVQIMALSSNSDADAMVAALRRHGYNVAVTHEPQDSLLHLEVGPFADNSAAQAMRQRLLLEGYNATVK
jgi:pilus assembly protein CpaC